MVRHHMDVLSSCWRWREVPDMWGYEKLPAQASRPTSPDPHIVTLVLTMRLPIESTERKVTPGPITKI